MNAILERAATVLVLLLPIFLTHGRGLADIDLSALAALFLVRSARFHDWAWVRTTWFRVALAWWAWLVICSTPGIADRGHGGWNSFGQAAATIRLPVLAAALECWVLADAGRVRWLRCVLAAVVAYIALQSLGQFATGRNLFGQPRFADGSLTGPYPHPRAAAPLSRLLFPVLVPWGARLAAGGPRRQAGALGDGALLLMVLMGQRMPLLLTGLGLLVVAAVMPQLRRGLVGVALLLPVLVAAAAVVRPPAFHHLWTVFSGQMEHLPSSPYGLIAARAAAMVEAHPILGLGFDGFRSACADPAYFHDWWGGDGRGAWAGVCVQHPHNHYLQAAVQAGLPGLVLFSSLVVAWIIAVARGAGGSPLQAGLLAALVMQEWPIASTSAFSTLPLGGWFFLLLGFGLATARHHIATRPSDRSHRCPTP